MHSGHILNLKEILKTQLECQIELLHTFWAHFEFKGKF